MVADRGTEGWGDIEKGEGVKYMVTEGDAALGGQPTVQRVMYSTIVRLKPV